MKTVQMSQTAGTVNLNATNDSITYVMLPFAQIPNRPFFFNRLDQSSNTVTIQTASATDTFANGATSLPLAYGYSLQVKVPASGPAHVFQSAGNSSTTGLPATAAAQPVQGITVTGEIDPASGDILLTVTVTPPSDPNFYACHLYLEIPDQSANPSFVVGSSVVGTQAMITGPWSPIDLGVQTYSAASQPWQILVPASQVPSQVPTNSDTPARLYAVSVSSTGVDPPPVPANQANATPNQAFTVTSLDDINDGSATNVTALPGPITATVLPDDTSTGKNITPILVNVSSVPTNIKGWCYKLVLTMGTNDPTNPANQIAVGSGPWSVSGNVPSGNDGISAAHSFTIPTPNSIQTAIVWCISGLVQTRSTPRGTQQSVQLWNNLVPGITPHWPIQFGTTAGTVSPLALVQAQFAPSIALLNNLFGVAPNGITNNLLGSLCVEAANLAANSVTPTAIAALAVGTAAIQYGAITYLQIGAATILGTNIALATITDANIYSVSANKITAGTISASITIQSPTVVVSGATFTIDINTSIGIQITGNSLTTTIANALLGGVAYGIAVTDGSSFSSQVSNTGLFVTDTTGTDVYAKLIVSGSGSSAAGELYLAEVSASESVVITAGPTSSSATSGSASALPSAPAGYWPIRINGSAVLVPYYN